VIRNAGGVVTDDATRSPAISQRLLGTEEIGRFSDDERGR
jgi:carbonic anhydrase